MIAASGFVDEVDGLVGKKSVGTGAIVDVRVVVIVFVKRKRYSSDHYYTDINNGTSADRQLATYLQHGGDDNREEALKAVVDQLVAETKRDVY